MFAAPGLIIAAPASNSGKTLVTLGLLRHFRNHGLNVGSFKAGPDYIDPAFHAAASGAECLNLDPWAMRHGTIDTLGFDASHGRDLVVGEGVMGLFDGATDGTGSTADLAALCRLPVILVINARGMAGSAGALVEGFVRHRTDVQIAGLIFNNVGGPGHVRSLRQACAEFSNLIIGCIPRLDGLVMPERHLGLVQAAEHSDLQRFLNRAATEMQTHLDMDLLLQIAQAAHSAGAARASSQSAPRDAATSMAPLGQRIAVARDAAFAFAYPHILHGWRSRNAEILPFSPLANEAPPPDCDAVYLPGGYPELYAGQIAANRIFLDGLCMAAQRGAAIFGECGGYMVAGEQLVDAAGTAHRMAGLLPLETSFAERRLQLGYRQIELLAGGSLGDRRSRFRGHEFHYATIVHEGHADPLFRGRDAVGRELGDFGLQRDRIAGSFVHLIDQTDN